MSRGVGAGAGGHKSAKKTVTYYLNGPRSCSWCASQTFWHRYPIWLWNRIRGLPGRFPFIFMQMSKHANQLRSSHKFSRLDWKITLTFVFLFCAKCTFYELIITLLYCLFMMIVKWPRMYENIPASLLPLTKNSFFRRKVQFI